MWGGAGRDETDLLEIRQFQHFLSEPQMTVMDRIERAAQNANSFFAHRLQGQELQRKAAGISQHLRKINGETRGCRTIDHTVVI